MKANVNKVIEEKVVKTFVTTVALELTAEEAKELRELIGATSYYERQQLFKSTKEYNSRFMGKEDIFGMMYEALDAAKI